MNNPQAALRPVELFTYKRTDCTPFKERVHRGYGRFHGWGVDSDELQTGSLTYTVAIVEMVDGTVELVPVIYVRFLDAPNANPREGFNQ